MTTKMKRSLLTIAIIITFIINLSAQVGVGNSPNPNNILDLSNIGGKYLLMPSSNTVATTTLLDSSASMIYFNGNLYYNDGTTINSLSPWDWDGTTDGPISSPAGAPVGIATIPTSSLFRLQIADAITPGVTVLGSSKASIGIGNNPQDSMHLEIDNNEIVVKKNANTADTLHLQKEGGVVEIGMSASASNNVILQVNGNIDAINKGKIKENGYDLLPSGSIIIWYNNIVPPGWALCDGLLHTNPSDPSVSITTPDLRERFIVGVGDNPSVIGLPYSVSDTGGSISSAHKHLINLPTTTITGGAHQHSGTTGGPGAATTSTCEDLAFSSRRGGTQSHTHSFTTDMDGTHSHTVSFPPFLSSDATFDNNRPPYYALVYIMKY